MRRGGLLIEMVIAIALFVGAGLIVTGAMRNGLGNAIRAQDRERAADIAASAFARVEAGLATVEEIDGPVPPFEDPDAVENFADLLPPPSGWIIEAESDRSGFGALTRLTVTASRTRPDGQPDPTSVRASVEGFVYIARAIEGDSLEESDLGREIERLEGP
ncbi:MAG: hypothetical protein Tsb0013_08660 [Phycisphaerales bacterium]